MKTIRYLSKSSSIKSLARIRSASLLLAMKWMSLSSIRRTSSLPLTIAHQITTISSSMRRTLCWCQMKQIQSSRITLYTNLSSYKHKSNSPLSKLKEISFLIVYRHSSTRIRSTPNGRKNKEVSALNTNVSWAIGEEKRALVVEKQILRPLPFDYQTFIFYKSTNL